MTPSDIGTLRKMLQGLVESENNDPPYSIGLLGKWGTGKSSIKELYLSDLEDDTSTDGTNKRRKDRILPITFNAWRFGGEDIKRALLRHVFLELGGDKDKLDDALFRQVQRGDTEKRKWMDVLREGVETWGWSLIQVLLVYAVVIWGVIGIAKALNLSNDIVLGLFAGGSFLSTVPVIKFLLDNTRLPRRASVTRVEAPATAAEIYEDLLISQLHLFKAGRTSLNVGKHCERIVIFVDDLDRLSPEEMISGLDAVRTFMELPDDKVPDNLGVVFVISCDEDRIAVALGDRRQRLVNPDLPGAVFSQTDAHRFLDRIFQFRMEIPPFPKRDMRSFAEKALRQSLPDLNQELEKIESSVGVLVDRMIHIGVGTPRNALQIVNCFVQSWWIAKRREIDGVGSERAGGLQQGAVTGFPLALGAISALRVDFPDFYRDLQGEPEFLHHFGDVFVRQKPCAEKPEAIQTILRRYATDDEVTEVRSEHRSLRLFIASIQAVPWPKTLRPILFLSQDPITRKYGDKRLDLYESFVSGDVQGVLEELGHAHDNKPLSDSDMRLLHDMVEDLNSETEAKQNDAAFVLASLSERFRSDTAHILLTPLAHRLSDSLELRCRLGVDNIERVIRGAPAYERKSVAARLIDDLLKTNDKIGFKNPSLEAPSLDEAMDMADSACSLALSVHKDDGLDERSEARLLGWLEHRQVMVEGGEQALPFSRFEEWVTEHEAQLLSLLGRRYPELIAEEIESNGTNDLNSTEVLRRSKTVFDQLIASGEESRADLWAFLTRYTQHGDAAFVTFSSDYVLANVNGSSQPDAAGLSRFLGAFGGRLQSPPPDLDLNERGECFIQSVIARKEDVDEDACESIKALVSNWGNDGELSPLATRLADPLCERFPAEAATILNDWTGRVLSDLPDACLEWLATSFESVLNDKQQTRLVNHLDPIHQTDNVNKQQSKRYLHFMSHASEATLQNNRIQSHLQNVFAQISERHANPNDYLYRTFPVVPIVLEHVPGSVVASTLHGVFSNTAGQPDLFAWLHGRMVDKWPNVSDEMPGYNPVQLFDQGLPVVRKQPSQERMPQALLGLGSMVKKELVPTEKRQGVVDAACVLWRHHPDMASQVIAEHDAVPGASLVADMIDGLGEEESEFVRLRDAWLPISKRCSVDQHVEIGAALLNKPAKGTEDDPDRCLGIWLAQKPDGEEAALETLVELDELNDEQRKRIWLQIEKTEGLTNEFFLDTVSKIAAMDDCPETVSEMLDFNEQITTHFTTQQAKFDLGNRLVGAFRASSSNDAKARLAGWLKQLDVGSVVKQFAEGDELSSDEIEILRPVFGKSRSWKKIEANKKSDSQ